MRFGIIFGTHDFTHDLVPTTHDLVPTTHDPRPTTHDPRRLVPLAEASRTEDVRT